MALLGILSREFGVKFQSMVEYMHSGNPARHLRKAVWYALNLLGLGLILVCYAQNVLTTMLVACVDVNTLAAINIFTLLGRPVTVVQG